MSKFATMALAVDAVSRMTIIHPITNQPLRLKATTPDGEGQIAYIDLFSRDSRPARQHDRTVADRQLGKRGYRLTADELEGNRIEKLAKLTKGWLLCSLDGTPLDVPFSDATARELYTEPSMSWLRDQVQEHTDNLGNYAGAPSNNSSTSPGTSATSPSPSTPTAQPTEPAATI